MLIRNDPFRELDRFADQVFGTLARPTSMPMDAWRDGDRFIVQLDLPGISPDKIDIDVERNVLMVKAERFAQLPDAAEAVMAERPWGVFSRQLILGDTLDAEKVEAQYDAGVLTLTVPIAQSAKPRKVQVTRPDRQASLGESQHENQGNTEQSGNSGQSVEEPLRQPVDA